MWVMLREKRGWGVNVIAKCIEQGYPVKILAWTKFKAFADNNTNVTQKLKLARRSRKHCGERRNACYHSVMFSKGYFQGLLKIGSSTLSQMIPGFYLSVALFF